MAKRRKKREPEPDLTARPRQSEWSRNYSNPVVLLSVLVVLSLVVLISAAVLGIDRGVLSGMARADYARGLITYIFAVVTIGIAVALVLSALTSQNPAKKTDARFQRGKEVLSLLLGVSGTIVGFYFGSETIKANVPRRSRFPAWI